MRSGDRLALARLLSRIEARDEELPELLRAVYPYTGKAEILGITGPPGAGKSTLVDQITRELRKNGKRVAIACVDPSSPFTGGAILGDRIRMQEHAADEGVYVRSMGTRGQHGGLSLATKEVVMTLDAAGFDHVIVETAGVGQTELDILRLARTIVVVLVPESGDGIQVMKAGIMEIADVFAVNKSDRPSADQLLKELTQMVGMSAHDESSWIPPIVKTVAHQGTGVAELVQKVNEHQKYLGTSGKGLERTREFLKSEVLGILGEKLVRETEKVFAAPTGRKLLDDLLARTIDPYEAAGKLG